MAKLCINEMTTYRWTFEEDVQNYAAAGIDGIGVWRQKLSDFGESKGAELLAESGLSVSSLLWAGGFTGSDGRTYKESVQDAHAAIQLAADLKAHCLVAYSGSRAGHTHNHARRLLKSALKELSPIAAEFGVTMAIEPMHPGCAGDWTFLTSLEESLDLIDSVGGDELKLAFETYHLGQDADIVERIPEVTAKIGIVQLGDTKQPPEGEVDRCRLGDGCIPLSQLVAALLDAGYAGPFEVELMGEEIETLDYVELIQHSQQFFGELVTATQT